MNELEYFRRIAGDNAFRAWLEKERALVVKHLAGGEGVQLHRAQGRFHLIEDILTRLEQAKGLR